MAVSSGFRLHLGRLDGGYIKMRARVSSPRWFLSCIRTGAAICAPPGTPHQTTVAVTVHTQDAAVVP